MSSNEARREVARLYFEAVVEEMVPLGRGEEFHHGFSWGIHEAANRAVGLSTHELADVQALAEAWAEENCPAVLIPTYEATSRACSLCSGRCKEAAAELVPELVD